MTDIILPFDDLAQWEQNLWQITQDICFDEWMYSVPINLPPQGTQTVILNNLPWNSIVVNIRGFANDGSNNVNAACMLGINYYGLNPNEDLRGIFGARNDITFMGTKNPYCEFFADSYDAVLELQNVSDRNIDVTTNPNVVGTISFCRARFQRRMNYVVLTDS